jgi:hypothetical protein
MNGQVAGIILSLPEDVSNLLQQPGGFCAWAKKRVLSVSNIADVLSFVDDIKKIINKYMPCNPYANKTVSILAMYAYNMLVGSKVGLVATGKSQLYTECVMENHNTNPMETLLSMMTEYPDLQILYSQHYEIETRLILQKQTVAE